MTVLDLKAPAYNLKPGTNPDPSATEKSLCRLWDGRQHGLAGKECCSHNVLPRQESAVLCQGLL